MLTLKSNWYAAPSDILFTTHSIDLILKLDGNDSYNLINTVPLSNLMLLAITN